jgi:hypothetical protein
MLPEIYQDPSTDKKEIDELIRRKRNVIEQDFYYRLKKTINPTLRKAAGPMRLNYYAPLKTSVREKCPPGVTDVVYYEDEQELFCFERQTIINTRYNPATGKPWRSTFLKEMNNIKNPVLINPVLEQSLNSQKIIPEKDSQQNIAEKVLAPGLFDKLREEISLLQTYMCTKCSKEMLVPRYKSIQNGKTVQFCTQECFDNYDF